MAIQALIQMDWELCALNYVLITLGLQDKDPPMQELIEASQSFRKSLFKSKRMQEKAEMSMDTHEQYIQLEANGQLHTKWEIQWKAGHTEAQRSQWELDY